MMMKTQTRRKEAKDSIHTPAKSQFEPRPFALPVPESLDREAWFGHSLSEIDLYPIQCKLKLGSPGDRYEQEADRVAEQIVRMPEDDDLQPKSPTYDEDGKKVLQAKESPKQVPLTQGQDVSPIVHDVLHSPGQPLDPDTRAFMELRFGHDFSQVRVHTDAKAAESADAVSALAFTIQNRIVFGAGQYDSKSLYGRKLFAHELVHTIQQGTSGHSVSTHKQLAIREPDDASEREADVASWLIAQGRSRSSPPKAQQIAGSAAIQRVIIRRRTEDGTSREARAQIDRARGALNAPNLAPEARRELQTRIAEAEAALSNYRAMIDSSSLGMNPMLATTMTGSYADILIVVAAGLAMLGAWIIGSTASRAPANREAADALAQALRWLAEAAENAQPQPEAPPQEVPAPQQLGPDIFPVDWYEPVPERPRPRQRNDCFEQNPTFIPCDRYYRDINEAAARFLSIQNDIPNVDFDNLIGCRGRTSFPPNQIRACNMGPGENWHCQVEGAPRPLSIFGCFCCEEDGTSSIIWRGAHWSRGT